MTSRDDYLARIGTLIRDARQHSGLTQSELATQLRTSQSAVNRIEKGQQNLTLEMIARIGTALDSEIVSVGTSGPSHLRVKGGTRLSGLIGGAQTNPAILGFANSRTDYDVRVALGYTLVYPAAMVVKILLAQVLVEL